MTLEQYIFQLEQIVKEVPKLVNQFVNKNQGALLSSVKLRFYQKGLDGNLKLIGTYASSTIERKKKSSFSRTRFVTLRDSGDWYNSLFVTYEKGDLFLDSTDKLLTTKLINGSPFGNPAYGGAIMEFTQQEIDTLVVAVLEDLAKHLEKVFNSDIEITI